MALMPPAVPDELDRLVAHFFCGPDARYGPYRPYVGDDAVLMGQRPFPGALAQYDLLDPADKRVTLQVYADVSHLGGQLWDQEVRVLLQIAAMRHPALPEVRGGSHINAAETRAAGFDIDGVAFVETNAYDDILADHLEPIARFMRDRPLEAVRQFSLLADGLSLIHGMGIVHRNLWPGTIEVERVTESRDDARFRLRLTRFEMSAMVANLLRITLMEAETGRRARNLFREQLERDPRALAYCSPERLDFIAATSSTVQLDSLRSDVYALGVVVWEWFLGPMPDEAAGLRVDDAAVRKRLLAINDEMRDRAQNSTRLPRPLRDLLLWMLHPDPDARPDANQVTSFVSEHYETLTGAWPGEINHQPYQVTIAHEWAGVLVKLGLLTRPPTDEAGRRQLDELIEDDIRGAQLIYSEHGAAPFVTSGKLEDREQARQLLIGRRAAWFCQPFRKLGPTGEPSGPILDEMLIIKYVVALDGGRGRGVFALRERTEFVRTVHAVHVFSHKLGDQRIEALRRGSPSWKPLIVATHPLASDSAVRLDFHAALDWLLEFQGIELKAREYAFTLAEAGHALSTLQLDRERDNRRMFNSGMSRVYGRQRSDFTDFFEQLEAQDVRAEIELLEDRDGKPGDHVGDATFREERGPDAFVIEVISGHVPRRGWVRPAADRGSRPAWQRQSDARWELLANELLLEQLTGPRTIPDLPKRWEKAGAQLEGEGRDAVQRMLVSRPFFALQGPPGTGKTEVAARAVAAFLRQEPTARVLVSAQSNNALDNLGERMLEVLGAGSGERAPRERRDVIAIRAASATGAARIEGPMKLYLPAALVQRRQEEMQKQVRAIRDAIKDDCTRKVLGDWLEVLQRAGPELFDRLRRGANLLFVTCASATDEVIGRTGRFAKFDWVVIEEAAKAWPTELAIPLVRGTRWCLIGDQEQLPAHQRKEVLRFLDDLAQEDDEELRAHGESKERYQRVFDLFGTLFRADLPPLERGFERPVHRLTEQRRMRDPICQVVSRTFYPAPASLERGPDPLPPGILTTMRSDQSHGLVAPRWLAPCALVWLDTAGVPDCRDDREHRWRNPGEARLVAELIASLRPPPRTKSPRRDRDPIVVLTPYRRQQELLRGHDLLGTPVQTIHAYQGRQADVVIVSLVRDTPHGTPAWRGLGHLTEEELVNVMLSRARDLLVLVGRFEHFRQSEVAFWEKVCLGVERYGRVVAAAEVMSP
jgi:AAA domain/Protein kinase domain